MDNQLENEGTASGTVGSASTNPLLKRNREEEEEEETDGEAGVDEAFYLSSSYKAALALGNPLPREGGDESDESAQWSNTTAYTNMEDDREASAPTITLPAAAAAKPASLLAPSISNFAVQVSQRRPRCHHRPTPPRHRPFSSMPPHHRRHRRRRRSTISKTSPWPSRT